MPPQYIRYVAVLRKPFCNKYFWDNLISFNYGLTQVRVCASQSILTAPKTILRVVYTVNSDCVASAISADLWSNGEII